MLQAFESKLMKNNHPELESGMIVRVHQKIREGDKERTQIFEGIIIKVVGSSPLNRSITVRKVVDGVGVEKIFPLQSSNVAKVEIKKKLQVRRSKLYFVRDPKRTKKLYEDHKDIFGKIEKKQPAEVTKKV